MSEPQYRVGQRVGIRILSDGSLDDRGVVVTAPRANAHESHQLYELCNDAGEELFVYEYEIVGTLPTGLDPESIEEWLNAR